MKKLPVRTLVAFLKSKNLPHSGKKDELVARVHDYLEKNKQSGQRRQREDDD